MAFSQSTQNAIALVGACLASLMFGLEISSVPVILPTLETALPADFRGLQWIMNAYTIACTTVLMATGTLADRYGRKRVFMVTTAAFGVTSLLCGWTTSASTLIAARFLQGLAGGAMFTCAVAILSHQFPDGRERGRAFSTWGVISGIGLGFGPVIGGGIVAAASWPWVFLIHVPLTVLALASAHFGIRESRDAQANTLDGGGIVALTLSIFGLVYLITQGSELGRAGVFGLGALTSVCLAAFVVVEKTHPHPMFDFSVFRVRAFSGAIVGCVGMNVCYWPFIVYLPIYFKAGLGLDDRAVGLLLLAYTIPFLVMPPVTERLLRARGPRVVIPLGMAIMGTGFALMRIGSGADDATWLTVLPGALCAGIGLGLTNTSVTNTTTGAVPSHRAGMASGIDISARLVTLAINIAVMGFVLLEGIRGALPGAVSAALDESQQKAIAIAAAAGNLDALSHAYPNLSALDPLGEGVHAALVRGFGWVMLYGAFGAWLLAALSFAVFGSQVPQRSQVIPKTKASACEGAE